MSSLTSGPLDGSGFSLFQSPTPAFQPNLSPRGPGELLLAYGRFDPAAPFFYQQARARVMTDGPAADGGPVPPDGGGTGPSVSGLHHVDVGCHCESVSGAVACGLLALARILARRRRSPP